MGILLFVDDSRSDYHMRGHSCDDNRISEMEGQKMSEYISKGELLAKLNEMGLHCDQDCLPGISAVTEMVYKMGKPIYDRNRHILEASGCLYPAVVVGEKTGKWELHDDESFSYKCSVCGKHAYGCFSEVYAGEYHYCPNCGARMVGE